MRYTIFAMLSVLSLSVSAAKERLIKTVESVNVESPVGTVPRLPYQLWVTYTDGYKEWRQVKWENSLLSTEQQEANAELYPVGKEYTINGYIIGDNTTDNGYPLKANIKVVEDVYKTPTNRFKAEPLPLGDVEITGDNRLTSNRDLDIRSILSWDISQQLYNYRDTYGLPTEGYKVADGWDSPTTKLKGHGSGHYMSALAFAYASASDPTQKTELHKRIERMVNELRECQERTFVWDEKLGRYWEARDYAPEEELKQMKGTWAAFDEYKKDYKKYGYGYLNAIPAAHPALIECYRAYNNEDWVWAPYYTIHKQLAGLIDISNAMKSDDPQIAAKALLVAKDMGLWVWNRMHYRTYVQKEGNKAERQARPGNRYEMWNMYIAGEVGGMAESLSRLSEMVSSPEEKAHLLEAANCFDAPAFFDPVARNIDDIRTRHANQHIPMIIGALRSYLGNNNPYYYNLAQNFWTLIQGRYAYAMGGVGNGEMWRQPYAQMLSMNTSVQSDHNGNIYPNPDINETCCAYNLAKLTKDLNCFDPDNAAYMDYYERVLYNQIVGSLHPEHWAVTYQYAVGMNARKPFGNETPQSTCCGGTGAENHVKYQEATYFANDNTLWVALYMPTKARWNGNIITQDCQWPADRSVITVKPESGEKAQFTLKLRVPHWATEGFDIRLNGKSVAKKYQPSSYVEIAKREWSVNDKVEVIMPFTTHINWGPDKMDVAATGKNQSRTPFTPMWVGTIMYGPLAMATSDIKEWKDADIDLSSTLTEIQPLSHTASLGYNGNLYSMSIPSKNIRFTPDYYQTERATHYLRLNVKAKQKKGSNGRIDKTNLEHAIQIAKERVKSQEEWEALAVKVPNFSPWAPNGYRRLVAQLEKADSLYNALPDKGKDKGGKQEEINNTTSALNVAINSMRPGNLAEPEDLADLLALSTYLKENVPNKSDELRNALRYADMVVRYVNDGSGTHDLIEKAIERLKPFKK